MDEQLSKEGPINAQKIVNIFNHQGYANQNYIEISCHPSQKSYHQKTTNVDEDEEVKQPLHMLGGI
jgi:hypothetical protein